MTIYFINLYTSSGKAIQGNLWLTDADAYSEAVEWEDSGCSYLMTLTNGKPVSFSISEITQDIADEKAHRQSVHNQFNYRDGI